MGKSKDHFKEYVDIKVPDDMNVWKEKSGKALNTDENLKVLFGGHQQKTVWLTPAKATEWKAAFVVKRTPLALAPAAFPHIHPHIPSGLLNDGLIRTAYEIKQRIPEAMQDSTELRGRQPLLVFVQTVKQHYLEWKSTHKEFLKVSEYPFGEYSQPFLIWVRKSYSDLRDILEKEEAKELGRRCRRFILLGTADIGMSFFTIFLVSYLTTKNERVVWKVYEHLSYLLDFRQDAATVAGPVTLEHPILQLVLYDTDYL